MLQIYATLILARWWPEIKTNSLFGKLGKDAAEAETLLGAHNGDPCLYIFSVKYIHLIDHTTLAFLENGHEPSLSTQILFLEMLGLF